jgi:deoxyribodipyrimidine photo-lyase
MTKSTTALVWFRQDLRLHDHQALLYALDQGYHIIPVFILDDVNASEWKRGGASRWWLHQSLEKLNSDMGGRIVFRSGDASKIIPDLVKQSGAKAMFWNRCYEPWRIARDSAIKSTLKSEGITVETFKDLLLWEPWEVLKSDNTPYKVFTPFYRKGCLSKEPPGKPRPTPTKIQFADYKETGDLNDLGLMPDIKWYQGMDKAWTPGEKGARARLDAFLKNGLRNYKEDRNRPDLEHVSRLSPHLHFGEISIREVWHTSQAAGIAQGLERDLDHFCSELGWREFSYSLLYHEPKLPREPLQKRFNSMPWIKDDALLRRWQKGQTGIPIVDAGMRQLWQTGWMHNRVRMIVASLLVKNMMIHWHEGEDWFWDCLVDADLANNAASWQWVAGCGADAAPYFRIFNPITQGEKFDPRGDYIRTFVPELKNVSQQFVHKPWESPQPIAGYPAPIVDLPTTRQRALDAFATLKERAL